MLKRIVPGHVRAQSFWVCLVLMGVVFWATLSAAAVLGVFLLVLGMFLGDQATHLAQENHQGPQPTWVERQQLRHRWVFVTLGLALAIAGLLLIVRQ